MAKQGRSPINIEPINEMGLNSYYRPHKKDGKFLVRVSFYMKPQADIDLFNVSIECQKRGLPGPQRVWITRKWQEMKFDRLANPVFLNKDETVMLTISREFATLDSDKWDYSDTDYQKVYSDKEDVFDLRGHQHVYITFQIWDYNMATFYVVKATGKLESDDKLTLLDVIAQQREGSEWVIREIQKALETEKQHVTELIASIEDPVLTWLYNSCEIDGVPLRDLDPKNYLSLVSLNFRSAQIEERIWPSADRDQPQIREEFLQIPELSSSKGWASKYIEFSQKIDDSCYSELTKLQPKIQLMVSLLGPPPSKEVEEIITDIQKETKRSRLGVLGLMSLFEKDTYGALRLKSESFKRMVKHLCWLTILNLREVTLNRALTDLSVRAYDPVKSLDNWSELLATPEIHKLKKIPLEKALTRGRKEEEEKEKREEIGKEKLAQLKKELIKMKDIEPQRRGYAFERFLQELFGTFDLKPKGPFKLVGEQIDGSIEFEGHVYLIEAKWQSKLTGKKDLVVFRDKVESKSTWSRGLFITFIVVSQGMVWKHFQGGDQLI